MNNSAATAFSLVQGGRRVSDLVPEVDSARVISLHAWVRFLGVRVILLRGTSQDVNFGLRFGAVCGQSHSTCRFECD